MPERARASYRRRKDARPLELLGAALAVFAEKGFAAARPEEIALLAGVSKSAFNQHLDFAPEGLTLPLPVQEDDHVQHQR